MSELRGFCKMCLRESFGDGAVQCPVACPLAINYFLQLSVRQRTVVSNVYLRFGKTRKLLWRAPVETGIQFFDVEKIRAGQDNKIVFCAVIPRRRLWALEEKCQWRMPVNVVCKSPATGMDQRSAKLIVMHDGDLNELRI